MWDGAYNKTLAANQKVAHVVATADFFAAYLHDAI